MAKQKMGHEAEGRAHPAVPVLHADLLSGKISRREFLRTATLLGIAAPMAYAMSGAIGADDFIHSAHAATAKAGGVLRVSMEVHELSDPALFAWSPQANLVRHMCEYLTITGADNVTRPYLAERWTPSDDFKTWTFYLRKGIKWHNGDDFNADDVVFNLTRWLDPATGSSNIGLFAAMTSGDKDNRRMTPGAVEKVDDYTVRLHLNSPVLSIPENFYNYPTMIVHRDFDGDLSKKPNGTGPFTLSEYVVGEKAILKRVPGTYWGGDVYLDEIHYYDHGSASTAQLAALASGQVDMTFDFDMPSLELAASLPNTTVYEAITAQTGCMRMRLTEKPFDDRRVRRAITLAADNTVYSAQVFRGRGLLGENHHVASIHPEYAVLPKLERNIAEAKALIADAGYPDGLDISIDVGNTDGPWQQHCCEILKQQLAPAGIRLSLNVMPPAKYWDVWNKAPFGLTAWTHRPLGTMVLSLTYRSGVPWNETAYANPAFDAALTDAEAQIDVIDRKIKMATVQSILQGDAVMVQPVWLPKFFLAHQKVRNLEAHPTQYHQFNKVWIDT